MDPVRFLPTSEKAKLLKGLPEEHADALITYMDHLEDELRQYRHATEQFARHVDRVGGIPRELKGK